MALNAGNGPTERASIAPGSTAVGLSYIMCKVLSIDTGTNLANVIDQVGNQRQISTTRVFGKGSSGPAVGDNWIITQIFGDWMFAVYIQTA